MQMNGNQKVWVHPARGFLRYREKSEMFVPTVDQEPVLLVIAYMISHDFVDPETFAFCFQISPEP